MVSVIPARFGVPIAERRLLWAPLYAKRLALLGSTAVIIPLGDARDEAANFTTVTTRGEEQLVFTYSEARSDFDTGLTFLGPANIPIVTFNGTDEEADSPDAAFWSRGNGTTDEPFSFGGWFEFSVITGGSYFFSKNASGVQEWRLRRSGSQLIVTLWDNSVEDGEQGRISASGDLVAKRMYHIVGTYGGDETNPDADIAIYLDTVRVDIGDLTGGGAYVAMENLTSVVAIGSGSGGGNFHNGKIAGGPLGPFFTQRELTADAVLRLYQLERVALNV